MATLHVEGIKVLFSLLCTSHRYHKRIISNDFKYRVILLYKSP